MKFKVGDKVIPNITDEKFEEIKRNINWDTKDILFVYSMGLFDNTTVKVLNTRNHMISREFYMKRFLPAVIKRNHLPKWL